MKKYIREFYESNGFPLNRVVRVGKRKGYRKGQIELALERTFEDYVELTGTDKPKRLEHSVRIDIARNVFKKADNIERKEYVDTENKVELLEKQNLEYTERWKFTAVVAGIGWLLVLIMKLIGIQGIL